MELLDLSRYFQVLYSKLHFRRVTDSSYIRMGINRFTIPYVDVNRRYKGSENTLYMALLTKFPTIVPYMSHRKEIQTPTQNMQIYSAFIKSYQ